MKLVTRSDFDGLVCGALLSELGIIDGYRFVHPKDVQDGLVKVTSDDVMANVPYAKGCGLWFDHHSSENDRLGDAEVFEGESRVAPSCARVIFEYYGGAAQLPWFSEMVEAADKFDSADLTADEIQNPYGWALLAFVTDPRTGLGRFGDFRLDNLEFIEFLTDQCRNKNIDELLELPDVDERVSIYFEQAAKFIQMVKNATKIYGSVIVTDLRGAEKIYAGNRFLVYSLYPEQNVSIWVVDGKNRQNCAIAIGHSVLNRTCRVDVGSLLLNYGGGGHKKMGTCQVEYTIADDIIEALVEQTRS